MDNESFFKSAAFGGFNKEDVIAYLNEADRKHQQEIRELLRRYEEVNAERNRFANQVQTHDSASAKHQEQLADSNSQLLELREALAGQSSEIEMLRLAVRKKNEELQEATEKCRLLTMQMESILVKNKQAKEASDQMDDALLEVRRQSEHYLEEIHEKNRVLQNRIRFAVEQVAGKATDFRTSIGFVRGQLEKFAVQFEAELAQLENAVDQQFNELAIEADTGEIISLPDYTQNAIRDYEEDLRRFVEERRAGMQNTPKTEGLREEKAPISAREAFAYPTKPPSSIPYSVQNEPQPPQIPQPDPFMLPPEDDFFKF